MELPNLFFNHDAQAGGFYPQAHVGIEVAGIGDRQNTLIEGIRGTGKTHVLKMIKRHRLDNFSERRILPIYVSLAQISEHAKKNPVDFRLHLYTHIVHIALETITVHRTVIAPPQGLGAKALRLLRVMFGLGPQADDIDTTLGRIRETAEALLFKLQYDLTSETIKQAAQRTLVDSSEATAGLKLGRLEASEKEQSSSSQTTSSETTLMYMGAQLLHKNAVGFIVQFLQQLQVLLDLEFSLVLLDECSEAPASAQTEIFRFLKTLRGTESLLPGRDSCVFFVGTVYPVGETAYPVRHRDGFSFEPGQDCSVEFLQWDEADIETYLMFFRNMLLSRARTVIDFRGTFPALQQELFESEDAFLLAAFCAHGIPRRFWETIRRAYDSGLGKILTNRLDIAVREVVSDGILGHPTISAPERGKIQGIIRRIARQNQAVRRRNRSRDGVTPLPQTIYFTVLQKREKELSILLMQGAVHDKSRMKTMKFKQKPQPIFALDVALAYTYLVVPKKDFLEVMRFDLPVSFAQAPVWKGEAAEHEGALLTPEDAAQHAKEAKSRFFTGIVRMYRPGQVGLVEVSDGGPDAVLLYERLNSATREKLQAGDALSFQLDTDAQGRRFVKNVRLRKVDENDAAKVPAEMPGFLLQYLRQAGRPVALSEVASQLTNRFGDTVRNSSWYGQGKLKKLLKSLDMTAVRITEGAPGYMELVAPLPSPMGTEAPPSVSGLPPAPLLADAPSSDTQQSLSKTVRVVLTELLRHEGSESVLVSRLGMELNKAIPGFRQVSGRPLVQILRDESSIFEIEGSGATVRVRFSQK